MTDIYFFSGCPWSSLLCGLSLVVVSMGYFSLRYAGFSLQLFLCCRAQALVYEGSAPVAHYVAELPSSMWGLPGPGIEPTSPNWQADSLKPTLKVSFSQKAGEDTANLREQSMAEPYSKSRLSAQMSGGRGTCSFAHPLPGSPRAVAPAPGRPVSHSFAAVATPGSWHLAFEKVCIFPLPESRREP